MKEKVPMKRAQTDWTALGERTCEWVIACSLTMLVMLGTATVALGFMLHRAGSLPTLPADGARLAGCGLMLVGAALARRLAQEVGLPSIVGQALRWETRIAATVALGAFASSPMGQMVVASLAIVMVPAHAIHWMWRNAA